MATPWGHCTICGLKIDLPDPTRNQAEVWIEKFSALWQTEDKTDGPTTATICRSGRRTPGLDLIPVGYKPSDSLEYGILLNRCDFITPLQFFGNGITTVWGFPFHYSCWELFQAVSPESGDIRDLFLLLRSQPVTNRGLIDWGHDYGGKIAWSKASSPDEGRYYWSPKHADMDDWDPLYVPAIKKAVRGLKERRIVSTSFPSGQSIATNDGEGDGFSSLPVEIVHEVLTLLPTADVASLRLASRWVAAVSVDLPNAFWVSRFDPGHEFEQIFEAREYLDPCWSPNKHTYLAFKAAVKATRDDTWALEHRARIYDLCLEIHQVLGQMSGVADQGVSAGGCQGWPCQSRFEPDGWDGPHDPDPFESQFWANSVPRQISRNDSSTPQNVLNVLRERIVVLPDTETTIYVSTILMFGRRYVSGLRFQDSSGNSSSLGYEHPDNESVLSLTPGRGCKCSALGLTAAYDAQGIRGLAMSCKHGPLSDWVGDDERLPKKELPAVLQFSSGDRDTYFKAKFDAVRIVWLASPPHEEVKKLRNVAWFPEMPHPAFTKLPASGCRVPTNSKGYILPVCFQNFGGAKGELAHRLIGLTVSYKRNKRFLSISMNTRDKKNTVRLGVPEHNSRRARREQFAIDGEGGERIIGIETSHSVVDRCLKAFRVHTTRGHCTFGLDERPHLWGEMSEGPSQFSIRRVGVDGQPVVGFWVTMTAQSGIADIGLMVAESPDVDSETPGDMQIDGES